MKKTYVPRKLVAAITKIFQGEDPCPKCNKLFSIFRWRWNCIKCQEQLCANCITKPKPSQYYISPPFNFRDAYCKLCWSQVVQPFLDAYRSALDKQEKIELFSKNYKGQINHSHAPGIRLSSGWYRDQDDCRTDIRVQAAFQGYDIVKDISIDRNTGSEPSENGKGIHRYSEFRITGTAVR